MICSKIIEREVRPMIINEIQKLSGAAVQKYNLSKNNPLKYMLRAIIAGAYLIVAVILSNMTAAVLYSTYPQFGRIAGAVLFPIGIIMIVFLGGELFTGNNLTMAVGLYDKKCTISMVFRVWILSYIGNFIGCFLMSVLFTGSGAGAALLTDYLKSIIWSKLEISAVQMVLRGILCNFMVCIAVLAGSKMKTETGKIVVMTGAVMAFVIAGLEHSVANMGTYTIGYILLGGLPINLLVKSMFFVTIGNILGGAVLLALPLKAMSESNENIK